VKRERSLFVLVQTALLKAIKYCGSKQKKLAQLIGEDPDKISYWLNRAKQIPFHQAIAIEAATDGIVSRYDLAPYARFKEDGFNDRAAPELSISERVYIGMQLEKMLGKRQGARSDLKESGSKCAQVKGKTTALVAKEAGFSSRDTYLRAKKVVEKGIKDVIESMDKKLISIASAAAMAGLPAEEQQFLIKSHQKEIAGYFKKNNPKKYSFTALFQEQELLSAERHYKLPLRLPLLGLLINYDSQGYFPWDPKKLQEELLPNMEMNFDTILERLRQIGVIKKIYRKDETIGQVLIRVSMISDKNLGGEHDKNSYGKA
jgi:DNA-binding transcriptional regulator YdaS (Cro superfamily)